jgi:hypothetical protein
MNIRTMYRRTLNTFRRAQELRPTSKTGPDELLLMAAMIEACEQAEAAFRKAWAMHGHKIPDEGLERRTGHVQVKKRQDALAKAKSEKVLGTFGCWDYPNGDWERKPTAEDIPEIMRQKHLRDPKSQLWTSQEKMVEWFRTKGWL